MRTRRPSMLTLIAMTLCVTLVGSNDADKNDIPVPAVEPASVMISRHSLTKPYYTSSLRDWKFLNAAYLTNTHVILTRDERSRQGGVWNLQQMLFPYWEVEMEFQVTGSGSELFGDGLVFWYVKEAMIDGPVFGYKDFFHGLGIFLDTYNNHNGDHSHEHPYVSVMVNDGTKHYDHDRDGTHTQLAGCAFPFRSASQTAFIKVRYYHDKLTVMKRMSADSEYQTCIEADKVFLPTKYFFGVTAATGDLSDEHRLIAFKTNVLSPELAGSVDRASIVPFAEGAEKERDHVFDDPKPNRLLKALKYLFYVTLIVIIVACGVYLFIQFQKARELRRKRFY